MHEWEWLEERLNPYHPAALKSREIIEALELGGVPEEKIAQVRSALNSAHPFNRTRRVIAVLQTIYESHVFDTRIVQAPMYRPDREAIIVNGFERIKRRA